MTNLNTKTTLVLISMDVKIKKNFLLPITTMDVARHRTNLLYITAGETSHYVLLRDLSRLIWRQNNNHNDKKYFWQDCLHDYTSEEVLKKTFGKMQVTLDTNNQAPRIWRQEGLQQSQLHKNRIPTTFTFCHLCGFQKCFT